MDIRVDYSGFSCFVLALFCMTVSVDWLAAVFLAGAFHELCHFLAVRLTGGIVNSIRIGISGAVMEAEPMKPWKSLICTIAGPTGSFLLLLFIHWIPKTALCGLVQGIFNLIPVWPLDGGRAFACIASMLFSEKTTEKICSYVKWMVLFLLTVAALWAAFAEKMGCVPLLVLSFFLSRMKGGKISCKDGKHRVQ